MADLVLLRTPQAKKMALGSGALLFVMFAIFIFVAEFPRETHAASPIQIVITATASTTWVVPADWNSASNTIEVIGGGGNGVGVSGGTGAGGGGGGYSKSVNQTLTPGATVGIKIGGVASDTYVCNATSNCASIAGTAVIAGAKGGTSAVTTTAGSGGATSTAVALGTGSIKRSGGNGASGGGGGGAASPSGNGGNASGATGGASGSGVAGGTGGNSCTAGTNGTEWSTSPAQGAGSGGGGKTGGSGGTGCAGGTYGAAGGTGNKNTTAQGGQQGIIVITYTPPTVTVSSTGSQIATTTFPFSGFATGGAFTFVRDTPTGTISQIVVTASGTLNANTNLSNLILYYQATSTCATSSIPGTATQFNATGVSFNTAKKATTTGSMAVGTSQICLYAKVDVGAGASAGQTFQLEIANPSTDATVNIGSVAPATVVALSGVTTVQQPAITVGTSGTQIATTSIPSSAFYVGGAFTFLRDNGSTTVTQIVVTESGTVNANVNLSNLKLFYLQQATCATSSIPGGVSTFNSTGGTFNTSEQSTVTGSMTVGTSTVCVYAQVDVGSGANTSDTLDLAIANPSTDVTVASGIVSPSTTVTIAGSTTLIAPAASYIEKDFRIYGNVDAVTPVSPLAAEDASATSIAQNVPIRLRLNIISSVGPTPTSSQAFKLQYAPKGGAGSCTSVPSGNFADVGAFSSSTIWRGFNNTTTADGAALTGTLLSTSTVTESYVEQNPSPANPTRIPANGVGEWDFVVYNNGATSGSSYCFRAVTSGGSTLSQYSNLPEVQVVRPFFQAYYEWRNDDGGE